MTAAEQIFLITSYIILGILGIGATLALHMALTGEKYYKELLEKYYSQKNNKVEIPPKGKDANDR
jgi:hypothetical protein